LRYAQLKLLQNQQLPQLGPYHYRLKYLERVPERPRVHLRLGDVLHTAHGHFYIVDYKTAKTVKNPEELGRDL